MRDLHATDPEFMERYEQFARNEVVNEEGQGLDDRNRYMAILATLIGCQGLDEFCNICREALNGALTPVEIKEIIYQAADYLGMGRMRPFLTAANDIMEEMGIRLPLEGQATTTMENRLEKGIEAQAEIFGDHMREAWKKGHINR